MPVSAAPFVSLSHNGFVPATTANVVSGTITRESSAVGSYGLALGNSITGKMAFYLPEVGATPIEDFSPYQNYNLPKTFPVNLKSIGVKYSVAAAVLTLATVGIYATFVTSAGPQVTTLLADAANGLSTAIGTHNVTVTLNNPPAIPANATIWVELDITTASGGTAIVYGIGYA